MHSFNPRRALTGLAIVLAGVGVAAAPAHAATISDGTSNTLQVGLSYTFENVMVESLTGPRPHAIP
jgi:hypothetical protein